MFCSRCGTQVDTGSKFCPSCGLDLSSITSAGQGATARMVAAPQPEDEAAIVREALKEEYDLEKELGRGGMAIVFKARDKQLEREVAIKVLPFSLSFDAEFVERFQREARTAGKLEHPNIIPIYRVGRAGRVIYFVMKFIRGKSLSAVIETRGAMPVPEIKRCLIECVRALGYAHKHGIVHRDIKPDNIMFDELGQAIVTDFGIAKAQSGAKLTGTGMSIGTPHYMSPEQARAQNLDGRSDIYSLGVVAYQCLTGHVPFDGEDSFSIGYKHIMEELPVPALETADQRDLFGVVQRMMAKKPEDRFQNADELVLALEGGVVTSPMDQAGVPTKEMEPMKRPPAKPAPAMASAATTPLPRASASMGKPKDLVEAGAGGGGAGAGTAAPPAPPKPKPRPVVRPKPGGGSKLPLAIAAVLALIVLGLGGYYFGVMKPQQVRAAERERAAQDSVRQLAVRDSIRRDSVARDSAARASRPEPVATATDARRPTPTPQPRGEGTLSLNGNIPPTARITVDGQQHRQARMKLPAGRRNLRIEAEGFRPYTSTVTIEPNQTRSLTVVLQPVEVVARPGPTPPGPTPPGTTPPGTTPPGTTPPGTQPRPAGAPDPQCATNPTFSTRNSNNACYDRRPVARVPTRLPVPSTCTGNVTPATVLVNVSATGEALGNPSVVRRSNCDAFNAQAQALVLEVPFQPAQKGGQNVQAWLQVSVQPVRN